MNYFCQPIGYEFEEDIIIHSKYVLKCLIEGSENFFTKEITKGDLNSIVITKLHLSGIHDKNNKCTLLSNAIWIRNNLTYNEMSKIFCDKALDVRSNYGKIGSLKYASYNSENHNKIINLFENLNSGLYTFKDFLSSNNISKII
jgi:hypothetical protein